MTIDTFFRMAVWCLLFAACGDDVPPPADGGPGVLLDGEYISTWTCITPCIRGTPLENTDRVLVDGESITLYAMRCPITMPGCSSIVLAGERDSRCLTIPPTDIAPPGPVLQGEACATTGADGAIVGDWTSEPIPGDRRLRFLRAVPLGAPADGGAR